MDLQRKIAILERENEDLKKKSSGGNDGDRNWMGSFGGAPSGGRLGTTGGNAGGGLG